MMHASTQPAAALAGGTADGGCSSRRPSWAVGFFTLGLHDRQGLCVQSEKLKGASVSCVQQGWGAEAKLHDWASALAVGAESPDTTRASGHGVGKGRTQVEFFTLNLYTLDKARPMRAKREVKVIDSAGVRELAHPA
jgi:hypothetical protein